MNTLVYDPPVQQAMNDIQTAFRNNFFKKYQSTAVKRSFLIPIPLLLSEFVPFYTILDFPDKLILLLNLTLVQE